MSKDIVFLADVGNTTLESAFAREGMIIASDKIPLRRGLKKEEIARYLILFAAENDISLSLIGGAFVGSVVPGVTPKIAEAVREVYKVEPGIYGSSLDKGLAYDVENPGEVGADIAADLLAARKTYGCPALIVDLGTISKYLFIDEKGVFFGCLFAPGIRTGLSSMGRAGALLPKSEALVAPDDFFGRNTKEAMSGGIYQGALSLIEKASAWMDEHHPGACKILAGGDALLFAEALPDFRVAKDLALRGLLLLYSLNFSR